MGNEKPKKTFLTVVMKSTSVEAAFKELQAANPDVKMEFMFGNEITDPKLIKQYTSGNLNQLTLL